MSTSGLKLTNKGLSGKKEDLFEISSRKSMTLSNNGLGGMSISIPL